MQMFIAAPQIHCDRAYRLCVIYQKFQFHTTSLFVSFAAWHRGSCIFVRFQFALFALISERSTIVPLSTLVILRALFSKKVCHNGRSWCVYSKHTHTHAIHANCERNAPKIHEIGRHLIQRAAAGRRCNLHNCICRQRLQCNHNRCRHAHTSLKTSDERKVYWA